VVDQASAVIVRAMADTPAVINSGLPQGARTFMPAIMSLFGLLNCKYRCFREGGPLKVADCAKLASRLMPDGARALPQSGTSLRLS